MKGERGGLLFLNNYVKTGIGDFGLQLIGYLKKREDVTVRTTSVVARDVVFDSWHIMRWRGTVIANIGLTTWGPSGFANFMGFGVIGLRAAFGRPTTILLHNIIEIIVPEDSGYNVDAATKFGAHLAVKLLSKANIVVFSHEICTLLNERYGIAPKRCDPLPCNRPGNLDALEQGHPGERPLAITLGYLAPYKGLPAFVEARDYVPSHIRMAVAGGLHRILGGEGRFSRFANEIVARMRSKDIDYLGYVPDSDLDRLLKGRVVGVLPYTSLSGASAAFSRFASAGVPVIATDLPEFRRLQGLGAGIVLVSASPKEIGNAVDALLSDTVGWERASRCQLEFASRYSWNELTNWLSGVEEHSS